MLEQLALDTSDYSLLSMILKADIVVQLVMAGLVLASIWTWAIIISFGTKVGRIQRKTGKFERAFSEADNVETFYDEHGKSPLPIARVLAAGIKEWRRSTARGPVDREGTRERLVTAMSATIANEIDRLADRLNFLATVGSVAPFVGLFGTVWGIMQSFQQIAKEQNTSLAIVAPGIAEALLATAMGLFAAIPAVIAYNRFSHRLNKLEARMGRFADGFHATLSRELEIGD